MLQHKADISNALQNLSEISQGIESLETIAYHSNCELEAADFAPMLRQIVLRLNKERKILKNLCGLEK